MSWGALGNALIGGHQAFRMAVADREEQVRREELDRRYQEEQRYRASRDTVEDQRWQAGQTRLDTQDKIAADALQRQQDETALTRAREYGGGAIGQDVAKRFIARGDVAPFQQRSVVGEGLGQGADLGSLAAAPAVAGIAGMTTQGTDIYDVRQTPEEQAAAKVRASQLTELDREEAMKRELEALDPKSPTYRRDAFGVATRYGKARAWDTPGYITEQLQREQNAVSAQNAAESRRAREEAAKQTADYRTEMLKGEARQRANVALAQWERQVVEATQALPTDDDRDAAVRRIYAMEPLLAGALPPATPPPPKPSPFDGLPSRPAPATPRATPPPLPGNHF
jgi:hypothetical protein